MTSDSTAATTHVVGICSIFKPSVDSWVLDSSAFAHICYDKSFFDNLHSVSGMSVTLPNQTRIFVHLIGDINLNSHIRLQNVMFIPLFQFNLISISTLTAN